MNDSHHHDSSLPPSAPHSGRSNSSGIWVGLFGAPLAWITQVSLSEPIAAHACYPYQTPLSKPIWEELPTILVAISMLCLATALLSGFMVWRSFWLRLETAPTGENNPVLDSVKNRNLFLLNLSAMSSFLFTVAIVFNICAIWLVSPCSSWF